MTKTKKPDAASRTVDMFTGKTKVEEVEVAQEDLKDAPRMPESIEQAAERWRNNAFFTQEHLSKHFNESQPGTAKFRLTEKDGWMFLEQYRLDKKGVAYHWAGLMFRTTDLYELTSVFVRASKAMQAKESA